MKKLKDKFFDECTDTQVVRDTPPYYKDVVITKQPNEIFDWFVENLKIQENVGIKGWMLVDVDSTEAIIEQFRDTLDISENASKTIKHMLSVIKKGINELYLPKFNGYERK